MRRAAFVNTLQSAHSETGLMIEGAAALRININTDGPPTATRKRCDSHGRSDSGKRSDTEVSDAVDGKPMPLESIGSFEQITDLR